MRILGILGTVAKENENVDDGNVIDAKANDIVNTTDHNVGPDNAGVTDADINETSTYDNVGSKHTEQTTTEG